MDADGYLLEESAVLSACARAMGRIIRGMPILTGFREDALDHAEPGWQTGEISRRDEERRTNEDGSRPGSRDPEPAWIRPRSPVPSSTALRPNSPTDSA